MKWLEQPLSRRHDRSNFDCGEAELNEYLTKYARQNHESGGAKTFVAVVPTAPSRILGYYSITVGSIEFARVPPELTKGFGRYDVPVYRLSRLAVDIAEQGKGLGRELLFAAGARAIAVAAQVGGIGLAIDAKNEGAAEWYRRSGARSLNYDPLQLFFPLTAIAKALRELNPEGPP